MKLAYFSPLAPKRTGIATYAFHLAQALSSRAELDFFDTAPAETPLAGMPIQDYVARPELLLTLPSYDAVLYHIGNNPYYHLEMYRAFRQFPGVVVLHDTVLYYLIAGLGPGGMLREFVYNYGIGRLAEFRAIKANCPNRDLLRYETPERYPLLKRILTTAKAIIVHSETSARLLRAQNVKCPVFAVPLLAYTSMMEPGNPSLAMQQRAMLGIGQEELLIGCFGFIGPTKRMKVVFEAVKRLQDRLRCRVLVVGEGGDIDRDIAASGLGDRVIHLGFVEEERFGSLLRSIDVLANLRFPSMGETSATLVQAMACGIPSVVSDDAWFAELPGEVVWKTAIGAAEIAEVEQAFLILGKDEARRRQIGQAAKTYVRNMCAPDTVALRYQECLAEICDVDRARSATRR